MAVRTTDDILGRALSRACADDELFGKAGVCPTSVQSCGLAPKVVLVTGDNASGKSLFCRYLSSSVRTLDAGIEVMPLGMNMRTSQGMQRAFVYGDERTSSTGQISLRSTLVGLRNATGSAGPRMLVLDEPDIGLSESFAAALGVRIGAFCAAVPEDCAGVVVVTHSRAIAACVDAAGPWRVRVGDDLRPTSQWLQEGPLHVDPDGIEALFDKALERFRAVGRILDQRKADAEADRKTVAALAESTERKAEASYRAATRGAEASGQPDLEAAARYLVAGLDRQAVGWQRLAGFAVSEGGMSYAGEPLGGVDFSTRRVREGVWRVTVEFDWKPGERFPLNSDGLQDMWQAVSRRLPATGRVPG
jgi:hypothetical protein